MSARLVSLERANYVYLDFSTNFIQYVLNKTCTKMYIYIFSTCYTVYMCIYRWEGGRVGVGGVRRRLGGVIDRNSNTFVEAILG